MSKLKSTATEKMPKIKGLNQAVAQWVREFCDNFEPDFFAMTLALTLFLNSMAFPTIKESDITSENSALIHAKEEFKAICDHYGCTEQEAAQHGKEALEMLGLHKKGPMSTTKSLQTAIKQQEIRHSCK